VRAVKNDHPYGKVIGEVLETMPGSRSDKQKVARLESVPLAVMKQDTLATDDDVNLVPGGCGVVGRGRGAQRPSESITFKLPCCSRLTASSPAGPGIRS
jgi:hypothetical protein